MSDHSTQKNSDPSVTAPATPSRLRRFAIRSLIGLALVGCIAFAIHRSLLEDVELDNLHAGKPQRTDAGQAFDRLPETAITASISQQTFDEAENSWDPLIDVANRLIASIDENIADYSGVITSQVRIKNKLLEPRVVACKIRHARTNGDIKIPFSVYTRFLKPKSNFGVEAIWVDGWHQGNIVAHAPGLLNVKRFYLPPEGSMAMDGNRYPIYVIGFRNLLVKLVEQGERERELGNCEIRVTRGVELNGVVCTTIEARHPEKKDPFDFHIARIYIDDERNLPLGYEGFLWPEKAGQDPPLLEFYFYSDVKLNRGFKAIDFEAENPDYDYPKW